MRKNKREIIVGRCGAARLLFPTMRRPQVVEGGGQNDETLPTPLSETDFFIFHICIYLLTLLRFPFFHRLLRCIDAQKHWSSRAEIPSRFFPSVVASALRGALAASQPAMQNAFLRYEHAFFESETPCSVKLTCFRV